MNGGESGVNKSVMREYGRRLWKVPTAQRRKVSQCSKPPARETPLPLTPELDRPDLSLHAPTHFEGGVSL